MIACVFRYPDPIAESEAPLVPWFWNAASDHARVGSTPPDQLSGAASKYLQSVLHLVPLAVNVADATKKTLPPPGPKFPTAQFPPCAQVSGIVVVGDVEVVGFVVLGDEPTTAIVVVGVVEAVVFVVLVGELVSAINIVDVVVVPATIVVALDTWQESLRND